MVIPDFSVGFLLVLPLSPVTTKPHDTYPKDAAAAAAAAAADRWVAKGTRGGRRGEANSCFPSGSPLAQRYWLRAWTSVTVLEGAIVRVPCVFHLPDSWNTYTPAYGYWFRQGAKELEDAPVATNNRHRAVQEETQGRFHLLGDPKNYNCSLEIRDTRRKDTGTYFFRVEKGGSVKHSFKENQVSVCVTALSQTPDINIQGTLESGHPRNITCTVPRACERQTSPTFSWIGVNLTSLGPRTPFSSVVTLTPGPQHNGTNLTCRVTFHGDVSTERTIQLNVSYAPQDMTISVLRKECTVQEGSSLRLLCVTRSNPPASLSWAQRGRTLQPSQPSDPGVLDLPQIQREHEGEVTCHVQNPLGSQHASLALFVVYPPQLLGTSCSWEDEGLHCNCSSHARPAPSLRWQLGEQLLEENLSSTSFAITSSSAGPWANSSLSLRGGLNSSLRLSCKAQNVHGAASAAVLLLPGRSGLRTGVVQGAAGGAGVVALLALCLCVIFFLVKIHRERSTERAQGQRGISESHLKESPSDSRLSPPPPDESMSTSEMDQELHYANLSFHGLKPPNCRDQEATEYSEIKIRK
ncbi:myeloid cell surface antigen CD33-like isoform X2 [Rousettus aegyptiacus]|uniref:myeloid cell surface antigen CD33-like isoform X2 n=1 Tax=Rousettus aegyptiacus TaxID=9407 RepID=UPI00168D4E51|nr:myeloid cell surface antigen CD33-like isoform X2 [Rousettus aegyptiacus]